MRCVNPTFVTYRNVMGVERRQQIPCGHCIACLHNHQDEWSIRLQETNNAHTSFIYDTLTFSPSGISYRNITDKVSSHFSEFYSHNTLNSLFSRYQCVDTETGEMLLLAPYVDRAVLQAWLKRGRELFRYHYGRRLKMKYFIVYENGPKTSRPHFHALFWGISHADYLRFFAKPWRRDMGFTKTKFIDKGSDKDRQCIARYLSKYVSKGVFESPLVHAGLIPKPYRAISHGIGEEYLKNSRFDWFRSDFARYLKKHSVDIREDHSELSYWSPLRNFIESNSAKAIFPILVKHFQKLGTRLTTYYDSQGYPHQLPRYYRHKLCNYKVPNFLSYALQEYLLEDARVHDNKSIQEFARDLGYRIADKDPKDTYAGFGRKLYDILSYQHFAAQVLQAKAQAKGRYIKLKNHYGRAMNLNYAYCN